MQSGLSGSFKIAFKCVFPSSFLKPTLTPLLARHTYSTGLLGTHTRLRTPCVAKDCGGRCNAAERLDNLPQFASLHRLSVRHPGTAARGQTICAARCGKGTDYLKLFTFFLEIVGFRFFWDV